MYKLVKVDGSRYIVKNNETKEEIVLSSTQEICDFILNNKWESKAAFTLNLFQKVDDQAFAEIFKTIWTHVRNNIRFEFNDNKIGKHILKAAKIIGVESIKKDLSCLKTSQLIELYKEVKHTIDIDLQTKLVMNINSDNITFDFLRQNKEVLNQRTVSSLIWCMKNNKMKLNLLEQFKGIWDISDIWQILVSIKGDDIKLDFLKQNPNISDRGKSSLLTSLSFDKLKKLYDSNQYDSQRHVPLDFMMQNLDSKKRLKFVNKYLEKFSVKDLDEFINVKYFDMKHALKVLNKNKRRLNSSQSIFLIANSGHRIQKKLYKDLQGNLDNFHKAMLLEHLKLEYANDLDYAKDLETIDLRRDIKEIIEKISQNFNLWESLSEYTSKILSEQALDMFGKNQVYQLFKYCIYGNKPFPDVSKVFNNQQTYNRFMQFRNRNIISQMLAVEDIRDSLIEFDKHYELITECMEGELTQQEEAILTSILKADNKNNKTNIEIANKAELQDYPTKRSVYIKDLDLDNAIIYTLTGMYKYEYEDLVDNILSDEQMDLILNDCSEQLREQIALIQDCKKRLGVIMAEPEENKYKILQDLIQDLEQEFTSQGSVVANLRNSFTDLEIELRKLYGAELQESLTKTKLPEAKEINGAQVIELNGEPFKLLVHGLNAYGDGTDEYTNKEDGRAYLCTSLVSNNCLYRAKADIYYGFKNISKKSLIMEGSQDIYSRGGAHSLNISASRDRRFLKTDKMLDETQQSGLYNEVVLYRDKEDEYGNITTLMPDYIVVFDRTVDEINEREFKEAKRLGIPIIVVNENIYQDQIKANADKVVETTVEDTKEEVVEEVTEVISEDTLPAASVSTEEVVQIIETAKDNCTAAQQEAIMAEMRKKFKVSQEQKYEQKEGLINNV